MYDYSIGARTALTGTPSASASGSTVTGVSTLFETEVQPGDYILLGDEVRIVDVVDNDTQLETTLNFTEDHFSVTGSVVRLLNVESDLGLPAPHGIWTPYTQPTVLGNGLVRGAGWRTAEWKWGFVTRAQRQILRAFCPAPAASANVYIKTRTVENSDAYVVYNANLVWPQQEEPQAGRRLEFSLKFQGLVAWP
jgi:hypothetical protein